jgi:hypothetical protein
MKKYRAEVRLQQFLTSVIDGTGVNLTPRELYTRESTTVGPRAGQDVSEKRKTSLPPPGFELQTVQPVASRYIGYATKDHMKI